MSQKMLQTTKWALASIFLDDAYTDFILSRQAMLCKPSTLRFYSFTAGKFIAWLKENGINEPIDIQSRHVRAYLAELDSKGLSDSYIHGHARAIRTFTRFLHKEKYITEIPTFEMPTIGKKRLLVLSAEELQQVVKACRNPRDKAIVLLIADCGIRRAEACALNWGDVEIPSGIVRIMTGKGGKYRSVVIGATTRRAILSYRRIVKHNQDTPLIQTKAGTRLTPGGLRSAFMRISERAGIKVTPHALRRTFATLSRRSGMDLLELQALMGHASLEMTKRYIEMLEDDLIEAHRKHGPIDRYLNW